MTEPIFPGQEQVDVIDEIGTVKLIRKKGELLLLSKNKTIAKGRASEIYQLIGQYVAGRVLEIGLGIGVFARMFLNKESVKSIISVEILPEVVQIYQNRLEKHLKHTIVTDDVASFIVSNKDKFDTMLFDIDYVSNRQNFDRAIQFMDWAHKRLSKNGVVLINFLHGITTPAFLERINFNYEYIYNKDSGLGRYPVYVKLTKRLEET